MIHGLDEIPVFEGLTRPQQDAIERCCEIVAVRREASVFEAGEPARALFVVRSGTIELRFEVRCYGAPVQFPLSVKRAGDVLGWSAMIPTKSYTLTACATEDAELLRIDPDELLSCCEADTRLGYVVMRNLARTVADRYDLACEVLTREIQSGIAQRDPLA